MKLIVTTSHPSLHEHPDPDTGAALHGNLGRLLTPRHTSSVELTAEAGITWACDNDCFQGLNEKRYVDMIDRVAGLPGCKFVTVPDVVGDAAATAAQFAAWHGELDKRGLPKALVLQNGQQHVPVPWDEIDAVFVGGDDTFKLGPIAASFAAQARRRGKWVHWGRVNTKNRIHHIARTGAVHSIDGSKWARWRKTYLDTGLLWVRDAERQHLSGHRALDAGDVFRAAA